MIVDPYTLPTKNKVDTPAKGSWAHTEWLKRHEKKVIKTYRGEEIRYVPIPHSPHPDRIKNAMGILITGVVIATMTAEEYKSYPMKMAR
jgi:hypothetical protein